MPAKTHFVRREGYGVTVIGRSDEGHRTVREVIVRSEFGASSVRMATARSQRHERADSQEAC